MCNRYVSPDQAAIERFWHIGRQNPWRGQIEVFPRSLGPFVRPYRGNDASGPERELVVGKWGLIPWFAKSGTLPSSTNNARFEEITAKASFKHPWQRGQRCIVPPLSFDEPCWETGRNVWWRFFKNLGERVWMKDEFRAVDFSVKDLRLKFAEMGNAAWFSCFLDDHAEWNGQPTGWDNCRWTGTLEKRGDRWIVAQMHFSFPKDD